MRLFPLLFLMLLAACATPLVQAPQSGIAAPAITANTLLARDGTYLPLEHWVPEKPNAVIIALHGFNDYARAFALPAPYWARRGVATYAYDQRGFGRTPQRGVWAGEQLLTFDLADAINAARTKHPGLPVYVLGESMGAAVAIHALANNALPPVDGLILVSPAVWGGAGMNPFYRGSLWLLAHMMPSEKFTGSDLKIQATDNLLLLTEMSRDPNIIKRTRVDAVYGIVGLMGHAYGDVSRIGTPPILMLYGGKDQVIPASPVEDVRTQLGQTSHLTSAHYPGGYHMLLRDLEGRDAWEDILEWISSRKP